MTAILLVFLQWKTIIFKIWLSSLVNNITTHHKSAVVTYRRCFYAYFCLKQEKNYGHNNFWQYYLLDVKLYHSLIFAYFAFWKTWPWPLMCVDQGHVFIFSILFISMQIYNFTSGYFSEKKREFAILIRISEKPYRREERNAFMSRKKL